MNQNCSLNSTNHINLQSRSFVAGRLRYGGAVIKRVKTRERRCWVITKQIVGAVAEKTTTAALTPFSQGSKRWQTKVLISLKETWWEGREKEEKSAFVLVIASTWIQRQAEVYFHVCCVYHSCIWSSTECLLPAATVMLMTQHEIHPTGITCVWTFTWTCTSPGSRLPPW